MAMGMRGWVCGRCYSALGAVGAMVWHLQPRFSREYSYHSSQRGHKSRRRIPFFEGDFFFLSYGWTWVGVPTDSQSQCLRESRSGLTGEMDLSKASFSYKRLARVFVSQVVKIIAAALR